MAKQDFDFAKATEDFFAAFKMDSKALDGFSKEMAEFNVKMSKIALNAAKKNVDLTTGWITDTIKQAEGMNKVQKDATAYSAVASEFASTQAQAMPEKLAQYAEVAKTAQLEAVELFTAASKDLQSKVASATKDMTAKAA